MTTEWGEAADSASVSKMALLSPSLSSLEGGEEGGRRLLESPTQRELVPFLSRAAKRIPQNTDD